MMDSISKCRETAILKISGTSKCRNWGSMSLISSRMISTNFGKHFLFFYFQAIENEDWRFPTNLKHLDVLVPCMYSYRFYTSAWWIQFPNAEKPQLSRFLGLINVAIEARSLWFRPGCSQLIWKKQFSFVHFGRLRAPILAPWGRFWHLGIPPGGS